MSQLIEVFFTTFKLAIAYIYTFRVILELSIGLHLSLQEAT